MMIKIIICRNNMNKWRTDYLLFLNMVKYLERKLLCIKFTDFFKAKYWINDSLNNYIITTVLFLDGFNAGAAFLIFFMLVGIKWQSNTWKFITALGNIHTQAASAEKENECQYNCLDFQNELQIYIIFWGKTNKFNMIVSINLLVNYMEATKLKYIRWFQYLSKEYSALKQ